MLRKRSLGGIHLLIFLAKPYCIVLGSMQDLL